MTPWDDDEFELSDFFDGYKRNNHIKDKIVSFLKEHKSGAFLVGIIICMMLVLVNNVDMDKEESELIKTWSESAVAKVMPKPDFDGTTVSYDTVEEFAFEAGDVTQIQFDNYVEKCKSEGFVNTIYFTDTYFLAKNNDGYVIRIDYNKFECITRGHIELSKNTDIIEKTTEEPVKENNNSYEVYVTPKGKKYHYSYSCAGKNAYSINKDTAEASYSPCKKCIK